jgi:hypothetical protein
MTEAQFQTLVRQIDRGDKWQKRFLILLAIHADRPLPKETMEEWHEEYKAVVEFLIHAGALSEQLRDFDTLVKEAKRKATGIP